MQLHQYPHTVASISPYSCINISMQLHQYYHAVAYLHAVASISPYSCINFSIQLHQYLHTVTSISQCSYINITMQLHQYLHAVASVGFKLAKKFREKFCLSPRKIGRSFDLDFRCGPIYSIHFPSAENREKFGHLGRLFLPSHPVGYSLISISKQLHQYSHSVASISTYSYINISMQLRQYQHTVA